MLIPWLHVPISSPYQTSFPGVWWAMVRGTSIRGLFDAEWLILSHSSLNTESPALTVLFTHWRFSVTSLVCQDEPRSQKTAWFTLIPTAIVGWRNSVWKRIRDAWIWLICKIVHRSESATRYPCILVEWPNQCHLFFLFSLHPIIWGLLGHTGKPRGRKEGTKDLVCYSGHVAFPYLLFQSPVLFFCVFLCMIGWQLNCPGMSDVKLGRHFPDRKCWHITARESSDLSTSALCSWRNCSNSTPCD